MMRLKDFAIWLLQWTEHLTLKHRFPKLCGWLMASDWWAK